jgi:hypothetical protein
MSKDTPEQGPVIDTCRVYLSSHTTGFQEPPNIDCINEEELVDNLDAMATTVFRNVMEEMHNISLALASKFS